MIAVKSEGIFNVFFNVCEISVMKKTLNRLYDPEGGVYSIQKLVINPTRDRVPQKRAANKKLRSVISRRNEAKKVPTIIARNVKEVISPLACEIFSVLTSSGIIPYLEGPKIALWVAKRNRVNHDPHWLSK